MKITREVRDYAAKMGIDEKEALEMSLEKKAQEFMSSPEFPSL